MRAFVRTVLLHVFPGIHAAADIGILLRIWVGSTLTVGAIALLDKYLGSSTGLPLIMGPFGASAVLCFATPQSPFARPRSILGGHVLSALAGVFCANCFSTSLVLAAGCAVGTAIVFMLITGTLHPPGGATALIAVTGGPAIAQLGYLYVLMPCLTGSLILVAVSAFIKTCDRTCRLAGACAVRDRTVLLRPRLRRRLHILSRLHKD